MKLKLLSLATLSMLVVGMISVAPAEARWYGNNNNSCANNGYNQSYNNNGFYNQRRFRHFKKHWRHNNNRGWFNNQNRFGLNTNARYW